MLQRDGGAPGQISTDISDMLFKQHLWSPACWTIFPIQDVLALDDKLKAPNPKADQINVPANPKVRAQGERVWEGCVCVCVCNLICSRENKETQARPSAAPHRGAARPCGCVFFDFPTTNEVTQPSHTTPPHNLVTQPLPESILSIKYSSTEPQAPPVNSDVLLTQPRPL